MSAEIFFFKLTPEGKSVGVGRTLGRSPSHRLPPIPQASSRISSGAEILGYTVMLHEGKTAVRCSSRGEEVRTRHTQSLEWV